MAFDPISAALELGSKLVAHFFPNAAEAQAAKLKLFEMAQTGELAKLTADTQLALAQAEINKIEAGSQSLLKSGWRPACGWVCAFGLAVQYVVGPLLAWGSTLAGHPVVLPPMDMAVMMPLLFGMLGLGTLRTVDKARGSTTQ
jgi:hypothetical protein